ncbi:MAG TPA: dTDP-4-dehydrorhamnose reductase [Terracidiphilus sp.]|nr:dTDP-4-dehydrorhamnose reductase [Terracidiphilus sp.]
MTEIVGEDATESPQSTLRTLILGAGGQLGRELERVFKGFGSVLGADRSIVDLSNPDQLRAYVRRVQPDVILNAAAYTAVDRAESERQLARAVNAEAPRILAEEASKRNALLVHYSTDYVFDGSKEEPWTETDTPKPLNSYGVTKLAGEQAIQSVGGEFLIFRTGWVYGPYGHNFLLTMLRMARERDKLSIVDDQVGAPTTTMGLARTTQMIVGGVLTGRFGDAKDWAGVYHMTCGGSTSWFGFADAIFARAASQLDIRAPQLIPIATKDHPTAAVRPRNSVLSNDKLGDRFGLALCSWESGLDEVMEALANQPAQ